MPWHYCPEEVFRKLLKSLPRPHPDPQLEWHLQLYDQCTKLKRGLERRKRTPLLSDEDLKNLKIVRGAPLSIDDCRPIDVERRFFLATQKWPEPDEESRWERDSNGNRIPDIRYMNHFANALWRMTEWEGRCSQKHNPWWFRSGISSVDPTRAATYGKFYIGPTNEFHEFEAAHALRYKGRTEFGPDPEVPHIIIMTCDTIVPDDRFLRSELLLAVSILRSNLALHPWLEHHTFPILVLSFHETGARILQMYAENNHFVVRVSRQLVFPTNDGSIPVDGLIMLTWMLAAPMGDTCFSTLPIYTSTDDVRNCRNEGDPKLASTLKIPAFVEPDFIPLNTQASC
ncbi:hypothetical protein V8C37DRAFT_417627 [Trichoderma ceciliae]